MSSSVRLWANPISTVSPGRATAASSIFGALTGGPPVGVDRELEAVLVYVFDLAVPDQEIFPVGPQVLGLLVADRLDQLGERHPVGVHQCVFAGTPHRALHSNRRLPVGPRTMTRSSTVRWVGCLTFFATPGLLVPGDPTPLRAAMPLAPSLLYDVTPRGDRGALRRAHV